ncbi:MAG TPA: zinc-finger domain-containing protein [Gammaproteobacteria bacterium]|nr:zinc-finger domain-containing protein [Gammaproteobacteria bacterium]
MQKAEVKKQACTKRHYEITRAHLPLSCPMPDMRIWDAHPRVYLPIEETGQVTCPYCGAEFVLKQ